MEALPASQSRSSHGYSVEPATEEPKARSTPTRRLLLAILRRAIWDFVLYRKYKEDDPYYALAIDAAGWLFWDGEENMTFRYICEQLGLNPIALRKACARLTRGDLSKINRRIESED